MKKKKEKEKKNVVLVSNSGFRDDESCYDSIEDYLPREPPPSKDFLRYRERIARIAGEREAVGGRSLAFRHIG